MSSRVDFSPVSEGVPRARFLYPLSSSCSSRCCSHLREQFRSSPFSNLSARRSLPPACLPRTEARRPVVIYASERVWPPPVCSERCSRLLFPPRSVSLCSIGALQDRSPTQPASTVWLSARLAQERAYDSQASVSTTQFCVCSSQQGGCFSPSV
jgi:hypothetical protein